MPDDGVAAGAMERCDRPEIALSGMHQGNSRNCATPAGSSSIFVKACMNGPGRWPRRRSSLVPPVSARLSQAMRSSRRGENASAASEL